MLSFDSVQTIRVRPLVVPWGNLYLGRLRLNEFQEKVYETLKTQSDILLYAPTGAGKTLTLLLSPTLPGEDMPGFVALYPNNTLLLNQMKTVQEVVEEALGGRLVDAEEACEGGGHAGGCVKTLLIYEISGEFLGRDVRYVALLALSGKYVLAEPGVPKREVLYGIAERIYSYHRRGGVYIVVFATPDVYLLVYTGAYRNFRLVGAALHNILVALASEDKPPLEKLEHILRKTGVEARSQVSDIISVRERLLTHPLFIDEFHLYGPYEVDALYALLSLFKRETGLPVVFSSATPAHDTLEELAETGVKHVTIKARTSEGGEGFSVRGPMDIHVVPVQTTRKGLPAYYQAGEAIPDYVASHLGEKLKSLDNGRALIILDRLWMVTETARLLREHGVEVECIATIVKEEYCSPGARVVVGSEATTQGVNLGRVVLGATGGVSAEDVIQRLGRMGRKGVESTVYLFVPEYKLSEAPPPREVDYYGLVTWITEAYPDYGKRKRDVSKLLPKKFHEIRRKLLYSLAVTAEARVSGNENRLQWINLTSKDAKEALDSVIGPPEALTRIILFRRTGFTVRYVTEDGRQEGTSTIGLITRNFEVEGVLKTGALQISFKPSRSILTVKTSVDPAHLKGRLVPVKLLLDLLGGRVEIIGEDKLLILEDVEDDALAYVADMGRDLADYLAYTGEGARIVHGTRSDYAVVFV